MDWVVDIERGVRDALRGKAGQIEIFSEYMDTKRIPFTPEYEQQVRDFLSNKFTDNQFATVLVTDNNAFDFVRRHGEVLFSGVPVVFCGINFFNEEQLEGYPNYTGVTETYDAKGTLSLALELHPNSQQVLVINDHLPTGLATEADIRQQLKGMDLSIPVRYAEKMPIAELERQLERLPADSIVLLGNYYRDGLDLFIPPKESSRLISTTSKAPVYSMLEFRIGQGVVGGYAVSGYRQGRAVGGLMAQILNGKPVSEIPVLKTGVNRLMFDSIQLDRFAIDPTNLPAESIQVNLNRTLFTHQERLWLEQHPVIRIAPDPDFPPIEYFDESGAYYGLAADYVRKLEEKIGFRFDIVRLENWDQAVVQAQHREVDMWAAASPTEQRLEYMSFTQPMIDVPAVIMTRRDEEGVLGMQGLIGKEVTVVSGYAAHDFLLKNYPAITLDVAPDIRSALRKVSFGEVDAMIGNLATSTYYMEQEGISNLKVAGESGYRYRLSLAVRSDWPMLRHILDKGLRLITEEERRAIMDRWVRFDVADRAWWQLSREQWVVLLAVLGVFAVGIVLAWNLILRHRVRERTVDLARINERLNEINSQLVESEEKYRLIFETSEDPMWLIEDNQFVMTNHAASRLLGYASPDQLVNTPPWELSPEFQPDGMSSAEKAKAMIGQAMKYGYNRFEWEHIKRDGTTFPVEVSLTRIPYRGHSAIFCMGNDITERKAAAMEIQRLATHDALTGLAGLRLAEDRIEMAIAKARREKCKMAILFIDLDGFKAINDEFGHDAGDALLKEVAARLESKVREVDTVARMGGDEFLIVLTSIQTLADIKRVSEQIVQSVRRPYHYEDQKLKVSISVGVALYPDHGETRESLVRIADRAMYDVKKESKNDYRVAQLETQGAVGRKE
ncbi:MAG: diguanylate cyclase [Candidatus Thiodiazotropha lotti]|nr:diguanylate cyclase [Candidatus Thiodiazotropha lotti]MCG8005823.1 diguanylate cyclase [Candidatus Thiodiazotropha lotti]MCG8007409.1 diguanylate cyclase [Candidatus Thiodiazotropha lotti]MCW4189452.1 diguanylate cyclase [Candidatus Thiodiazotropha lotti]MCW4194993.1 diguanylate cyclase [Candidatus Thiodiazotropha lotti]